MSPRGVGRPSLPVLAVALVVGCASTPRSEPTDFAVLTSAEIDALGVETAFDAIRQLRPRYLRGRALVSVTYPSASLPVVYMDGFFRGDITSLHTILVHDIEEIQFIGASDATTWWGTGHAGGVIHVLSRERRAT
jgi:hypothetical protein